MLEQLREQLNRVDDDIVRLIAQRQSIVSQIGKTKRESGMATRDYTREKNVIDRARDKAAHSNLDPAIAEAVMNILISGSLQQQEQANISSQARDHEKTALVMGGLGKMGRWFSDFLTSQGYATHITDVSNLESPYTRADDWRDRLDDYDVIALATPIKVTSDLLNELATLKPSGLIFDMSSLKSPLRQSLGRLSDAGCRVTSIHPMFGPDTRLLSGKHVIFINVGDEQAVNDARTLFDKTMAEKIDMSLEDHDRLVAYILGLSHALNIAFFTALRESGSSADELARLSSTTFDAQLSIARSVSAENPHLYFEIQSLNDYRLAPLNALSDALSRLRTLINSQDESGFVRMMERGHDYLTQSKYRD